jgi:hypothetical protein
LTSEVLFGRSGLSILIASIEEGCLTCSLYPVLPMFGGILEDSSFEWGGSGLTLSGRTV